MYVLLFCFCFFLAGVLVQADSTLAGWLAG